MPSQNIEKEEAFHDCWADSIDIDNIMVDECFEACTSPENQIILKKLGNLQGKKILELGCGAGEASVCFAKKGAEVTATDISNGMLQVVRKVAQRHGVIVETKKTFSNNIDFPDESFDIVYAANLLHHVEIESTISEAKRVLKNGGMFVSWDPLDHNPLINLYRKKATDVRTEDERPLKMSDLKVFNKHFKNVEIEFTWFFTLWLFIKFFLINRIDPNKERYWKKIIVEHKKLERSFRRLERLDKVILTVFPFLKRFCWNIVVCCRKSL